jgi:hypothetical protein
MRDRKVLLARLYPDKDVEAMQQQLAHHEQEDRQEGGPSS